jgi:hypothetical protein
MGSLFSSMSNKPTPAANVVENLEESLPLSEPLLPPPPSPLDESLPLSEPPPQLLDGGRSYKKNKKRSRKTIKTVKKTSSKSNKSNKSNKYIK